MKNLHFAIICSYNCVKHCNELEELTEEQRDLLFDFECTAWSQVTEDGMHHYIKPLKPKYRKCYKTIN